MIIKETLAKSILSSSKIYDYALNPYTGCAHACSYCYARFMKRFSRHSEPWGEFVDVKTNAAELLQKEIMRKKRARVWMSGVCDPYQPVETKYGLSRKCLETIAANGWPLTIQTRSPLLLRDIDILQRAPDIEVLISITTADEHIRELFEPGAPPVMDRIEALGELHRSGIRTGAMIAPMLPGAERLPLLLDKKVDHILVDRMNYNFSDRIYSDNGLSAMLTTEYFRSTGMKIEALCRDLNIKCRIVFKT